MKTVGARLIESTKKDFLQLVDTQKRQSDAHYNDDEQYQRAVSDLLECKGSASIKIKLYLEEPSLYCKVLEEMDLRVRSANVMDWLLLQWESNALRLTRCHGRMCGGCISGSCGRKFPRPQTQR